MAGERRQLEHRLAILTDHRRDVDKRIARLEGRLEETRGLGRISRRPEREQIADRLEHHQRRKWELDAETVEVRRRLEETPNVDVDALREERDRLGGVLDTVAAERVRTLERDPPTYLTRLIGTQPHEHRDRAAWRQAAEAVETLRARWLIDDPGHPFGLDAEDPTQKAQEITARAAIRDALRRQGLEHGPESDRGAGIDRGLGR